MTSEELDNAYDSSDNNAIGQEEWDQAYARVDRNGDAVVTQGELNAAVGGFSEGG